MMDDVFMEYEQALDELLEEARTTSGIISMRSMWNRAIQEAIESIERSAYADEACSEDPQANNDSAEVDRLKMRSRDRYELAANIRGLLVPND